VSTLPEQRAFLTPLVGAVAAPVRLGRRPLGAERRYLRSLVVSDGVVAVMAASLSLLVRYGVDGEPPLTPLAVSLAFTPIWLGVLGLARAYEPRYLHVGSEEFRRVIDAGVWLSLAAALLSYSLQVPLARGYLLLLVLTATTGTIASRLACRKRLHHRRAAGAGWMRRTIVAGHDRSVHRAVRELRRTRWHGYEVVGVCLKGSPRTGAFDVPVTEGLDNLVEAVERADADAVVVLPCRHLDGEAVRRLGWELEGAGTQLLVAPGLVDVAPERTTVSLVGAMPLVHIAHAELRGVRRLAKDTFDAVVAAAALLVLAPLLLAVMVAIRLDSPGPALFRQERVGRDDRRFVMYKLRTMVVDAEDRRAALVPHNQADGGVLFKLHEDPRVTRVGRWLRRFSIDELPQLFNVLLGEMSLVGPRPPLPSEVRSYPSDVRRRLAVKPGLTGLWQVSGRSDLPWEEAVRLDLQYVENWSLMLDLSILWRTTRAVLSRAGAY